MYIKNLIYLMQKAKSNSFEVGAWEDSFENRWLIGRESKQLLVLLMELDDRLERGETIQAMDIFNLSEIVSFIPEILPIAWANEINLDVNEVWVSTE